MPDGTPVADFVLNDTRYKAAQILVAGKNFACGSSREHARMQALSDYGFRVVIARRHSPTSFSRTPARTASFWRGSSLNRKLKRFLQNAQEIPGYQLTVSLEAQTVTDGLPRIRSEVRRWIPSARVLPARRTRRYRPDVAPRCCAGRIRNEARRGRMAESEVTEVKGSR